MSAYGVNKFCYRLTVDSDHRRRVHDDLQAAMEPFDLTESERVAIVEGDVASLLLESGANAMLLVRLFAFGVGGLTEARYSEQMRRGAEARGIR